MEHRHERRSTRRYRADPLAEGLRALTVLARCGPLDLAGFARCNDLPLRRAEALIAVFEDNGLSWRLPGSARFAVTPFAMTLIGPRACGAVFH